MLHTRRVNSVEHSFDSAEYLPSEGGPGLSTSTDLDLDSF